MKEIKCPNCGKTFAIDEGEYAKIVNQVRDDILKDEIASREKDIREKYESLHQTDLTKKDAEIAKLKSELETKDNANKLQTIQAIDKEKEEKKNLEMQVVQLKGEIEKAKQIAELEKSRLNEEHLADIRARDAQIDFYKNLKAATSVKLLGENLEQHCLNSFNQIRAYAYPRAYFEKDNDVVDGTKGDFVFRDFDENGTEYISIMFEMKNEGEETASKHKNEDFFKKLDDDRKKKKCEYAVLVTLLEKDSELYNQGIVDVSHRYEKMFVIRPQFFLPLIGLLDGANRKSITALAELKEEQKRNIDITNFETRLGEFQKAFSKNYETAANQFETAIEEIGKTITHLEKVRDNLTKSKNQLRLANEKAQGLSIKNLTKDSPSLVAKFEAIDVEGN